MFTTLALLLTSAPGKQLIIELTPKPDPRRFFLSRTAVAGRLVIGRRSPSCRLSGRRLLGCQSPVAWLSVADRLVAGSPVASRSVAGCLVASCRSPGRREPSCRSPSLLATRFFHLNIPAFVFLSFSSMENSALKRYDACWSVRPAVHQPIHP